jgi:hypothetical protein
MPTFLVSTVRRRCPPEEPSGYLYAIDLPEGRVIQRSSIVEPLYRDLDTNPRGGMRGSKGIAVRPDQIALANFSRIFRYDPQWKLLGTISHPSCAGIHDILWEGDSLWAAGARADLLLRFGQAGELEEHMYLRRPSPAIHELGWKAPVLMSEHDIRRGSLDLRHPLNIDKETYDRAHLNSVCRLSDGRRIVSLGFVFDEKFANLLHLKIRLIRLGVWPLVKQVNRLAGRVMGKKTTNMDQNLAYKPAQACSALVELSEDGRHRLLLRLDGVTAPSHSLLALDDDTLIYLNTTRGDIVHFDPAAKRVLSQTHIADKGFLRGVTKLDNEHLLVGSRGEIITFHLPSKQVAERLTYTQDAEEAVYDIKELPGHYGLPPLSLGEDFEAQVR